MATPNGTWLLLDIGNTHTVAGLALASQTSVQLIPSLEIRYRTDPAITADEYRASLSQLFAFKPDAPSFESITHVLISTVVPALETTLRDCFKNIPTVLIQADCKRDFQLALPEPNTLGADRLANVAGALSRYQPPLLIIDAGTATTFCLVDKNRTYRGGAIVPGFETSFRALTSKAARLFSVELKRPISAVGNTTETQLASGMIHGYEALIEGLADRLIADLQASAPDSFQSPTLIATGGCIRALQLSPRFTIDPDLTLQGLLRYGELNFLQNPLGDSS